MKAALTVWDGRVSPVFDVSREALLLIIEDGSVAARSFEVFGDLDPARKVDRLLGLGVDTLVCGAISEPLRLELSSRGVRVLGFVAGTIEEVEEALVADRLPSPALSMPGCGRQRRFRGGGGRRRGGGRGKQKGPEG